MHVGRGQKHCPNLKVHGFKMEEADEVKYLGDIICADGRNSKNIRNRVIKGIGSINHILNILNLTNFGTHTMKIPVLLRNSILVNGILVNAEIWYNMTK